MIIGAALLAAVSTSVAQSGRTVAAASARYMTYDEARPVLQEFQDELPDDLKTLSPQQLAVQWPEYVRQRDQQTRARLEQGEEDSLVNLLLFGTSFTSQPRITNEFIESAGKQQLAGGNTQNDPLNVAVAGRIRDLLAAMRAPHPPERIAYMRGLLERKGYSLKTSAGQEEITTYLIGNLQRVRDEFARYKKVIESASRSGDASEEFAARSTLFQTRGVSLDTSIMPNYAIEDALKRMLEKGLITKGSIRNVAIVGPGLDFINKQEGYDFYPEQSIQPFIVMDSLLRLGLTRLDDLHITTLDISDRVNQHLAGVRRRAMAKQDYVIELPLDMSVPWESGAVAFWKQSGDRIGAATKPAAVPAGVAKLDVHAVRIPASTVLRVKPVDLNVVWQTQDLPSAQQYDLVIGTNIFVYYNEFEQALTLDNLQRMVRPGGFLLSNNGFPEVRSVKWEKAGYSSTAYSPRHADGDFIIWYRRTK